MTKEIWDEIVRDGAYVQELDWYAIDHSGNLGIFSAAMHAPIPGKVKKSYDNYIELKLLINSLPKSTSYILRTTEQGNFSDWITYAEKGLFAFDFQDVHRSTTKNQYDLIVQPMVPLNLKDANIPTNLLDTFFQFDCDFLQGDLKTELIE